MNIWGMKSGSGERLYTSRIHGNFWAADGFQNTPSVRGSLCQGRIAMNGCDPKEIQSRV